MSEAEAADLVRAKFPAAVAGDTTSFGDGHGRVRRYLGPRTALVEDGEGRRTVAMSQLPLQTPAGAPVDLALVRDGSAFVPRTPLVRIRIGDRPAEGVELESGVAVAAIGGRGVRGAMVDDAVLYAGEFDDTDYLVKPWLSGADLSWVVRSPAAPERFRLKLRLAEGQSLARTAAGVLEIRAGDKVVTRLLAPAAVDAQGTSVPAEMALVAEDVLEITMAHRDADLAYPILLDPPIVSGGDLLNHWNGYNNFANWQSREWGASFWVHRGPGAEGNGLYLGGWSQWYPTNTEAEWFWQHPDTSKTTFIPSVEFRGMFSDNQGEWFTDLKLQATDGSFRAFDSYSQPFPLVNGAPVKNHTLYQWANGATRVGWQWRSRGTSAGRHQYLNEAIVHLRDPERPTVSSVSHTGTVNAWTSGGAVTSSVTGADPGIGIWSLRVRNKTSPSSHDQTAWHGCEGHPNAHPCPGTWSSNFTYNTALWPEGVHTVAATSSDILQGSDESTWTIKVDKTAPGLTVSDTGIDGTAFSGSKSIAVRAEDARSGVDTIKVFVNGVEKATYTGGCDGCPASGTFTFNTALYPDGQYNIEFRARDRAGNEQLKRTDGRAAITRVIADDHVPTITGVTHSPALNPNWNRGGSTTSSVAATDVPGTETDFGSGVLGIELLRDGAVVATLPNPPSCSANVALRCPRAPTESFPYSMSGVEGIRTFTARAKDGLGTGPPSAPWTFKIDSSGPSMTPGGSLQAASGQVVTSPKQYVVDATDGSATGGPAGARSGLSRIEFYVAPPGQGKVLKSTYRPTCAGTDNCSTAAGGGSATYQFDPAQYTADGVYRISALGVDAVGNTAETWVDVIVDRAAPVAGFSGPTWDARDQAPFDRYGLLRLTGSDQAQRSGIQRWVIKVDNVTVFDVSASCSNACARMAARDHQFDQMAYTRGTHTVTGIVYDGAGNASAPVSFTIHTSRPSTELRPQDVPDGGTEDDFGDGELEPERCVPEPDDPYCGEDDEINPYGTRAMRENSVLSGLPNPVISDIDLLGAPTEPVVLAPAIGAGDMKSRQADWEGNAIDALDDPQFQALGLKRYRVIMPWNVAIDTGSQAEKRLAYYRKLVQKAFDSGMEVMVSFEHQDGHNRNSPIPESDTFAYAFKTFRNVPPLAAGKKGFGDVRFFAAWNEANCCEQGTRFKPTRAASYFNRVARQCNRPKPEQGENTTKCSAVAGDFLDSEQLRKRSFKADGTPCHADNPATTDVDERDNECASTVSGRKSFFRAYKEKLYKKDGIIWAIHPYAGAKGHGVGYTNFKPMKDDVEKRNPVRRMIRFMTGTRASADSGKRNVVWITEVGGIVRFASGLHESSGGDPNAAKEAAHRDLRFALDELACHLGTKDRDRLTRIYQYQWVGAFSFDAGLKEYNSSGDVTTQNETTDFRGNPLRPAYETFRRRIASGPPACPTG